MLLTAVDGTVAVEEVGCVQRACSVVVVLEPGGSFEEYKVDWSYIRSRDENKTTVDKSMAVVKLDRLGS